MGLDNGIIIRNVKKEQVPPYVINRMGFDCEDFEACYWRKCWGIRRAILSVLDPMGKHRDDYELKIESEDVPALRRALKPFFDDEYWDENADSIWEYEEYKDILLQDWVNLCWLKEYLENNPETECYFYDSY